MKTEYETGEKARMFIALDLPKTVREMIWEWGETALADPRLRRVPIDSLHLTLAFLGDRPLDEVDRIEPILEEMADRTVLLELEEPVVRPERGKARFVALPTDSNPVRALGSALAEVLTVEGLYQPPKREFWPHVTVARARPAVGVPGRLEIPAEPTPTAAYGWFDAVRLALYRSDLQSEGSRYAPLAQVELPGLGGSEVI